MATSFSKKMGYADNSVQRKSWLHWPELVRRQTRSLPRFGLSPRSSQLHKEQAHNNTRFNTLCFKRCANCFYHGIVAS